jgi:hypothetical protein
MLNLNPDKVRTWGQLVLGIITGIIFCVGFAAAWLSKDQSNLGLFYGAIITLFTQTVQYFIGSSASSQKKDDIIADRNLGPNPNPNPNPNP